MIDLQIFSCIYSVILVLKVYFYFMMTDCPKRKDEISSVYKHEMHVDIQSNFEQCIETDKDSYRKASLKYIYWQIRRYDISSKNYFKSANIYKFLKLKMNILKISVTNEIYFSSIWKT